jgi:hypothetical protein
MRHLRHLLAALLVALGLVALAAPASAAVTQPTAVRNAIADLVVDAIDAGASAGRIFNREGVVAVTNL